jgi:hypothetical protein
MGKTQQNLKASEEFIRAVLMRNFNQKVDTKQLRSAAEKLCEAVPGKKEKVAA